MIRRLRGTCGALRGGRDGGWFLQHLREKLALLSISWLLFKISQFSSMFLMLNYAPSTGSITISEKCDRPHILCTRDAAIKPLFPLSIHCPQSRASSFTTRQSNYFFSNPQWIPSEASRQMNDRKPLNFSGYKERSQVRNMMRMLCSNPEQLLKFVQIYTPS